MSPQPPPNPHDVLIAGAGPVGLMLATELQLAGAKVLVVERNHDFDTAGKAGGINTASVEALQRRGLLPALQAAAQQALPRIAPKVTVNGVKTSPYAGSAGHFGGITVPAAAVDMGDPVLRGRGRDGWIMLVPQVEVEKVLFARAQELGVDIWRGVGVQDFQDDGDGVRVWLEGGEVLELRVPWVVGCDGGHSLVRRIGGFDFPGTDPQITGRQAVVEIEGAEKLKRGWQYTATGVYVYGPMPGYVRTLEFDGPPANKYAAVTAEEMEGSLRRVSGINEIRIPKVLSGSRFTDNARQSSDYRRGRVLLCGDAAHVHSPLSGQGLNLGLGDAVNLGWKLGGVVRGWLPEKRLDTYTSERHPIGMKVLEWTRAQVAVMRGSAEAFALRGVVTDFLSTRDGATHYVKQISGLGQSYDLGLPEPHPLVGKVLPDIVMEDGTRLWEHMQEGRALLLDLTADVEIAQLSEVYKPRLKAIRCALNHQALKALFVRPDGFVAWAGDCNHNTGSLKDSLRFWLDA
ncbi:hypothetical protein N7468_000357 [Penicillium chermesinum]|uniref:FAD-binding domain-containing protein n=1 Tax=Penicillium chermesinum TaxID=63820 RepID=A0A9W9PK59_9EURO|nr:uncharacterized protein N7468_000357 [Penicillium chermesinum]KAJ5248906.1 hypothetical protein N7468_000357 [Penicillium chermesinum]KAJ6151008.1 hypothetical protein N7470_007602 [Penicillium chermesinum]